MFLIDQYTNALKPATKAIDAKAKASFFGVAFLVLGLDNLDLVLAVGLRCKTVDLDCLGWLGRLTACVRLVFAVGSAFGATLIGE